jgi:hypothetical protein
MASPRGKRRRLVVGLPKADAVGPKRCGKERRRTNEWCHSRARGKRGATRSREKEVAARVHLPPKAPHLISRQLTEGDGEGNGEREREEGGEAPKIRWRRRRRWLPCATRYPSARLHPALRESALFVTDSRSVRREPRPTPAPPATATLQICPPFCFLCSSSPPLSSDPSSALPPSFPCSAPSCTHSSALLCSFLLFILLHMLEFDSWNG